MSTRDKVSINGLEFILFYFLNNYNNVILIKIIL
jgi:hypothetical protein